MLALELNNNNFPHVQFNDTVERALQLVTEYKLSHLPVVSEDKFIGLISEKELLSANSKILVGDFQNDLLFVAINENDHFLRAVNLSNQYQTNIIPVINFEKDFMGTISGQSLLGAVGYFAGSNETGALIVLEMEKNRFTISEISRILESNGATILHLNTTVQPETGLLRVTINIDKKELSVIIAAFERYEYDVVYYFGEESFENEIQSNYRHLMNYLDI